MLDREWLERPYVSRISAASAAALRPLRDSYNARRSFEEQVKPFNFLICVHAFPFSLPAGYQPGRFQLIAPFEPDPRCWLEMEWTDHYSSDTFRIHTERPPSPDSVKVKTNRDVLDRYRAHPEPKSLDAHGEPCARQTIGLLQRRMVRATDVVYIGKESNRLEDVTAGIVHDPDEILSTYSDPQIDPYRTLVLPILRNFPTHEIAAVSGLDRRTVQRLLRERHYPHRRNRATLIGVAVELAASSIRAQGAEPPQAPLAVLRHYLDHRAPDQRTCPVCGAVVASRRATYCGEACKKKAYRLGQARRLSLLARSARAF